MKEHFGAQNRTRTCTSLNTRTWNERVYQFRHLGFFNYELRIKNYECPCSLIVSTSPHIPNSNSELRANTSKNFLLKKAGNNPALFLGAANETRTRDPDLGKVVLYQLSYCRIMWKITWVLSFPKASAKVLLFFDMTKFFEEKIQKKCIFLLYSMLYGIFLLILHSIFEDER